jgi:NTP pyrophosphatase (non-canonical NTP hydrolase)
VSEQSVGDAGVKLTLDRYQELAAATDLEMQPTDPLVPLLGLAGEVGALIAEYKKRVRPGGESYVGFEAVVATELGDILWYLAALARRVGRPLSEVAHQNLQKTQDRYGSGQRAPAYSFDEGFPDGQRLPRRFEVTFTTYTEDGLTKCRIRLEGEEIGDPIDDNSRQPDNYRFHDVFHVAHAAILGWSPVLRSLIRRKRGFDPNTDRIEDGARAIVTEEAITAMVFELAASWDYFDATERIDDGILRAAKAITGRLEVGSQPASAWERAILTGYSVWRDLRDNEGGRVTVDLDRRTLEFAAL